MACTLVVGLGNPILTDDGVGVKVAAAVRSALPPGASVDVVEASVGGLRLMEMLVGYERAILVDAFMGAGIAPGSVQRLTVEELAEMRAAQHTASAHDADLTTALDLGRRMGLPLPAEIIIYGIGAANVVDFGEEMTPAVAAAVPRAATAVLQELYRLEEGSMISPELLRRYPFFAGLSYDHIVALANAAEEMAVDSGHYFFREGDELTRFYLTIEGAIGILNELPDQAVDHKLAEQLTGQVRTREVVVSTAGPGDVFGWSGLLAPHRAASSAKALAPARVIAFDCPRLLSQFEEDCRFGYLMMQKIAQVIRERLRDMRIESLAFVSK
jgi:hydrogenase maturation protease